MNMFLKTYSDIAWVNALCNAIMNFVGPIMILACVAGVIYAIWVGIKFVRAEDKSQRDEAKQKLITVIVGIVVTVVLIILFYWLAGNISSIIDSGKGSIQDL